MRALEGGLEAPRDASWSPIRSGTVIARTRWPYLIALVVAVGVLAAGGTAAAQPNQKTDPKQLWDAYPLAPGDEKAEPADPAPTPTPVPAAEPIQPITVAAADSDGGGLPTSTLAGALLACALLACAAGTAAGATLVVRRRRRTLAVAQLTQSRPQPVAQAVPAPAPPKPAPAPPRPTPPRRRPTVVPPQPDTTWLPPTAEPEPEPATAAGVGMVPAERFARPRPWPKGTSHGWTCQIEWRPGYRKAAFRAMAAAPGAQRRQLIAESAPVMWTLMSEPDPPTPEKVAALKELVDALADQGWERIEAAGPWYAQRFVWRHAEQPRPIRSLTGKVTDG
jgi:hypothetical protein